MSHHSHIKDFMVNFREASMDWMLSLRREWEWLGWDRLTGTWNWRFCHFRLKVSDWLIGCCFDWLFDWSFGGNGSMYGFLCCSALLCWIGILAVEMSTIWYMIDILLGFGVGRIGYWVGTAGQGEGGCIIVSGLFGIWLKSSWICKHLKTIQTIHSHNPLLQYCFTHGHCCEMSPYDDLFKTKQRLITDY